MRFRPLWCLTLALSISIGWASASRVVAADTEIPIVDPSSELSVPTPSPQDAKAIADITSSVDIPDVAAPTTQPASVPAAQPTPQPTEQPTVASQPPASPATPAQPMNAAQAPTAVPTPETAAAVPTPVPQSLSPELVQQYKKALSDYRHKDYAMARKSLADIIAASSNDNLTANSLCLMAACDIGLGEYDDCLKSIETVTRDYPQSSAVQQGYVTRFAVNIIGQVAKIPTTWDYMRWQDGTVDGQPQFKESVPLGTHIVRLDFRLGFGLLRCLQRIAPDAVETADAKKKLVGLLTTPITFVWIDEKAHPSMKGHPADFLSKISLEEKKRFSEVVCERVFNGWKTDKMYQVLDFYDEVRNLKHRYTAIGNGPNGTLTLAKVFYFAGYDPFTGKAFNPTESSFGASLGL